MKIRLEKFKYKKHFFKYLFGVMNFKILKRMGVFEKKFFKRVIKHIFSKNRLKAYNYVIMVDNKIVGGIQLGELSKRNWFIGMNIFKKHWRKGIATSAIKKLFIIAKKKGIKKINAEIFHYNTFSMKLVKKLGFRKVGEDKKDTFWEKKLK